MAGMDRHTGKMIGTSDHIRQSIEAILTTPVGSRVMRRDFGFPHVNQDGSSKTDLDTETVARDARHALETYEPRARFLSVEPLLDQEGALLSLNVRYLELETDAETTVTVSFPATD